MKKPEENTTQKTIQFEIPQGVKTPWIDYLGDIPEIGRAHV